MRISAEYVDGYLTSFYFWTVSILNDIWDDHFIFYILTWNWAEVVLVLIIIVVLLVEIVLVLVMIVAVVIIIIIVVGILEGMSVENIVE